MNKYSKSISLNSLSTMNQLSFVIVLVCLGGSALGRVLESNIDTTEWEGRIVGGSTASVGQFPHQASLRTAANGHFCGAGIVNTRWVVSAAHCTIGRTTANTRVVVGAHSRTTGGLTHTTSRIVNHPSYNSNTLNNDISVVQTAGTITYTTTVRNIPLGSATLGSASGQISGWGQTSVNL